MHGRYVRTCTTKFTWFYIIHCMWHFRNVNFSENVIASAVAAVIVIAAMKQKIRRNSDALSTS